MMDLLEGAHLPSSGQVGAGGGGCCKNMKDICYIDDMSYSI